jgi:hypothetical protein
MAHYLKFSISLVFALLGLGAFVGWPLWQGVIGFLQLAVSAHGWPAVCSNDTHRLMRSRKTFRRGLTVTEVPSGLRLKLVKT